jgi:hypothetical protein
MLTGEVKQRLIQVLTEIVERHRTARANVTEKVPTCSFVIHVMYINIYLLI